MLPKSLDEIHGPKLSGLGLNCRAGRGWLLPLPGDFLRPRDPLEILDARWTLKEC